MCPPTAFPHSDTSAQAPASGTVDFIPPTIIAKGGFALASSLLSPAILNHSVRTYLYAKTLAERANSIYAKDAAKHDLLFTACLFHDIGTTTQYNGVQRFEVEGGDAAVEYLQKSGVNKEDAHEVWMAIALHTSAGIAERINELTSIVRKAVLIDFGGKEAGNDVEGLDELRDRFEGMYARQGVEKVLGDAVVEQAVKYPEKAPPASWPGILYRAHLAEPEWEGVNKAF